MAGRPHAAHPENSGWLQQSLLLLRDSVCSRAQPQPAAGRVVREVRMLWRRGRERNRPERNQPRQLWPRSRSARCACRLSFARILDETDLEQLRFSSIEPQDVTEDFVALVASSARLAPHFHVPLQSGSDRILRAMHRWYRTAHYAERVRADTPDAARCRDRRRRDRGIPGRDGRGFSRDDRIHRATSIHLLACLFVFRAPRNRRRRARRCGAPANHSRARPRAAGALARQKSAEFRASQAGRMLRALTLARSWRRLDGSADRKLFEGADRRAASRERVA